jgi:hypothetical protein
MPDITASDAGTHVRRGSQQYKETSLFLLPRPAAAGQGG